MIPRGGLGLLTRRQSALALALWALACAAVAACETGALS